MLSNLRAHRGCAMLWCCAIFLNGCGAPMGPAPRSRAGEVAAASDFESLLDSPVWSVTRRGHLYVIEHPRTFTLKLATALSDRDGWRVVEIDQQRVRFASTGEFKALTVYPDGRAYCDGEFRVISKSLADPELLARQHDSPAEISVAENFGRVNRSTAGDGNNDGYNENSGAYQIVASGPRLELTISPRTPVLVRPVLEVAGLGRGKILVTMEGRLVESVHRSGDHVLIELPGRLNRATVVNIRSE